MDVIINASPFIYLGKIGKIDLLQQLYQRVITTIEVKEEVLVDKYHEYAALKLAFDNWIEIMNLKNKALMNSLKTHIHIGEASVIVLAIETQNILILDDLDARTIVKSMGIKISGTLGVLLDAMYEKIIDPMETKNLVDKLINNTPYRISVKLYQRILNEITRYKDTI